jgi:hypothetical protein
MSASFMIFPAQTELRGVKMHSLLKDANEQNSVVSTYPANEAEPKKM